MNEDHRKQILIVDDDTTDVLFFRAFLKGYALDNDLMHIPTPDDAMKFLLDGAGEIKLIIIGISDNSKKALDLMREIKAREVLKYIPLVLLTNFWGATEVTATSDYIIHALHFRPLDAKKSFRIIELISNL